MSKPSSPWDLGLRMVDSSPFKVKEADSSQEVSVPSEIHRLEKVSLSTQELDFIGAKLDEAPSLELERSFLLSLLKQGFTFPIFEWDPDHTHEDLGLFENNSTVINPDGLWRSS